MTENQRKHEALIKSFPFETYDFNKKYLDLQNIGKDGYTNLINICIVKHDLFKKLYLNKAFRTMKRDLLSEYNSKNAEIIDILEKNQDRLILVQNDSFYINPLVYDENTEEFIFEHSYNYDFINVDLVTEFKNLTTIKDRLLFMLEKYNGIVLNVHYIIFGIGLNYDNEELKYEYSGKHIKRWADNILLDPLYYCSRDVKIANSISYKYFKDKNSLSKFIYYYIIMKDDGNVTIKKSLSSDGLHKEGDC